MKNTSPENAHQVTVFGEPDFDVNGKLIYPKLIVRTLRPPKFYPLFTSLCSHRPLPPHTWNRVPQDLATAWLLRERRAIDFADATGLTLSVGKRNNKNRDDLDSRVQELVKTDHTSYWESGFFSTTFMLSELYDSWEENQCIFSQAGLIQIRVPVCLAPWGGIDRHDGQKPEGCAHLYCDASSHVEMAAIASKIKAAALTAPRWDDAKGVSYV